MDVEKIWSALKADERGLVTAVVQHAESHQVLMVAMVNRDALERTLERRRVTFWSRSRSCIWEKGETSPRAAQRESLAEVRTLGKREALKRLEAMA